MRRFAGMLALALLLTACGGGGEAAGLTGTVNTDGSSSMADVMGALQEAFRDAEPGVRVNYSGTGSGAGVEAVLEGRCDIGLSSRSLKPEENQKGAGAYLVALDAIAVIVHESNPVKELTGEELTGLFSGEIVNWKELGGEDAPVAVYGREAGSGTRSAFEEALGLSSRCAYRNIYGSNGDVIGNVGGNPNAIGYASLPSLSGAVAAVVIDGAVCSEETVRDGSYPLQRPFLMVVSREHPLSAEAEAFLRFAQSEEASAYIAKAGAISP